MESSRESNGCVVCHCDCDHGVQQQGQRQQSSSSARASAPFSVRSVVAAAAALIAGGITVAACERVVEQPKVQPHPPRTVSSAESLEQPSATAAHTRLSVILFLTEGWQRGLHCGAQGDRGCAGEGGL